MSDDSPSKPTELTKPQLEALVIFDELDTKNPGAWHRPLVLGKRSRNAWRLRVLGLVEHQDVFDKTGKAFAHEYRISAAGQSYLKGLNK